MITTLWRLSTRLACFSFGLAVMSCVAPAWGQQPVITEEGVIAGAMDIDWKSRTDPAARDTYTLKLAILKTTEYSGKITHDRRTAALGFNVDLALRNPRALAERKVVGKWIGTVPFDAALGVYDIGGGGQLRSPLRFSVEAFGKQPAMMDSFDGRIAARLKNNPRLVAHVYHRLRGAKAVPFRVAQVDPVVFDKIHLAQGVSESYPHSIVSGRLDYVPATHNWLTDGLTFQYGEQGQELEDVVLGSVKWTADENRKINGKGFYELNLRFNEAKHAPAALKNLTEEEAYFAVDDSIPCLLGRISYEDQFLPGTDRPVRRKVTYDLTANKLTKTQIVNFSKFWLLMAVPFNDE